MRNLRSIIAVAISGAIMIVSLYSFPSVVPNGVYAQISNPTGNNTSTSSNATNYLTYKDPQGRFTIDYPLGWNLTPQENRFSKFVVEISSMSNVTNIAPGSFADLAVNIVPLPSGLGPLLGLQKIVIALVNSGTTNIPNFQMNQQVECSKYIIDGHKACSFIFTRTTDYTSDVTFAEMDVVTVIGNQSYLFKYESTPDGFDQNLPIIDKMLSSFKSL